MNKLFLRLIVVIFCNSVIWAGGLTVGDGSAENPYLIRNFTEFLSFTQDPNYWAYGVHTKLTADIDLDINLQGRQSYTKAIIAPDTSFSNGFQGIEFKGSFDGGYHKISNLIIYYDTLAPDYLGLFGKINNGTIKNLDIVNANINGDENAQYHGGICGENYRGQIINCTIEGKLLGGDYTGLIVGRSTNGNISYCKSTGVIYGSNYIGGLIGESTSNTIKFCFSKDCKIIGNQYIGGLIGSCYEYDTKINYCFANCQIIGNYYVGGFLGGIDSGKVSISNSYSRGILNGIDLVGGFVGFSGVDDITNCYSATSLNGYGDDIGGFVGDGWGNAKNCFWDVQVSGIGLSGDDNYGAIGKTTQQMQYPQIYQEADWQDADRETGMPGWTFFNGIYPAFLMEYYEEVPDIRGMHVLDAEDLLQKNNFNRINRIEVPTMTGANGEVMGVSVMIGGYITPNINIDLIVSNGRNGDGSKSNPYAIAGKADLEAVNNDPCACYRMTADIFMGINDFYKQSPVPEFSGRFDGNWCVIKNLNINSSGNTGLFGKVGDMSEDRPGFIINLGLENVSIQNGDYVGALAGLVEENSKIANCYSTGRVTGDDYVGGLIGKSQYSKIEYCFSDCNVNGSYYTGGFIGENDGTIENCYSAGTVSGVSAVGGFVGEYNGWMENCYSKSKILTASGQGFCGNSYINMSNCFWDVNVSGVGTSGDDNYGAVGKTTEQLKQPGLFEDAGWEFADFEIGYRGWYKPVGDYPKMHWQNPDAVFIPDLALIRQEGISIFNEIAVSYDTHTVKSLSMPNKIAGLSVVTSGFIDKSNIIDVYLTYRTTADGSSEKPFPIACVEDLEAINIMSENYDTNFSYVIVRDIYVGYDEGVFSQAIIAPDSINNYSTFDGNDFDGTLDGDFFTINNLDIEGNDYIGLIGEIGIFGQVKNLGLNSCNFRANIHSGGICGYNQGKITNCYVDAQIIAKQSGGGICGMNQGGTISNCFSLGSVSSYFSGNIGGLVGVNTGSIYNSYSHADVNGKVTVGGLCGSNGDFYGQAVIKDSYATGKVVADAYYGGLCGKSNMHLPEGTIENSFWDVNTTGVGTTGDDNLGATGKTTYEMQTLVTYADAGWDFTNESVNGSNDIWRMCEEGIDYPKLWWQFPAGDIACGEGINFNDFTALANNWFVEVNDNSNASDINFDGIVDIYDLVFISDYWLE